MTEDKYRLIGQVVSELATATAKLAALTTQVYAMQKGVRAMAPLLELHPYEREPWYEISAAPAHVEMCPTWADAHRVLVEITATEAMIQRLEIQRDELLLGVERSVA